MVAGMSSRGWGGQMTRSCLRLAGVLVVVKGVVEK